MVRRIENIHSQIGSVKSYPRRPARLLARMLIASVALFMSQRTAVAQVHSSTSAHTSFDHISMTGYQGWFGTRGDRGTDSWRHYSGANGFRPGSASIEYWPDMREASEDEKYATSFTYDDGSPAYVFSSVHPATVNRHFRWMKEYGIDGAFMQRFRSDFGLRPVMNVILGNALAAAREHDRAIALMYDIGANIHVNGVANDALRTKEVNRIFDDWKFLVDELGLTTGGDDQPYLYHHGKPLVVLWGVGFQHRHTSRGLDMKYWVDLVDSLQNSSQYGGCSIMLGIPTYWREPGGDSIDDPQEHAMFLDLVTRVDIVQPWHTSRFSRAQMRSRFKNLVEADLAWCNAAGINYAPTISPGIREFILHGNGYQKPRDGGYYFWDMAKAALEVGSELLYLGMFDEVDEGTQYHKIDNNPPFYSESIHFADYGSDPEDHYLWLAGEATRALKGEFSMGASFRPRADAGDFRSEVAFVDGRHSYDMALVSAVPDRLVYYADPYTVPDGAPTVGTVRDASLFANLLTADTVTFPEQHRGLYIRFVEVDASTDKVLAYDAQKPTQSTGYTPPDTVAVTLGVGVSEVEDLYEGGTVWLSIVDRETRHAMEELGESARYTVTIPIEEGSTVQYSFGYQTGPNPDADFSAEVVPEECGTEDRNRSHTIGSSDLVLPIVVFDSCDEAPLPGRDITDEEGAFIIGSNDDQPWISGSEGAGSPSGEQTPNLIDNDIETKYLVRATRSWVNVVTDQPSRITAYSITSANDVPPRDPRTWVFQGWNAADSHWVTLHSVVDNDSWGERHQRKTWYFENGERFDTYRLAVVEVNGDFQGLMQMAELEIWGSVAPPTSVGEQARVPVVFRLEGNYPNPFNPTTVISYYLAERAEVALEIYNLGGQLVHTLVQDWQESGHHNVHWNAADHGLASGLYFCRLGSRSQGGQFMATHKMVLMK